MLSARARRVTSTAEACDTEGHTLKILLLGAVKASSFAYFSWPGITEYFSFVVAAAPFGLPISNNWFDGFICGYGVNIVFGSAVSSLLEPDKDSSRFYKFFFRYAHMIFNRSTVYYTHPEMWDAFKHGPRTHLQLTSGDKEEES